MSTHLGPRMSFVTDPDTGKSYPVPAGGANDFNSATLRDDVAPSGDASGLIPEDAANEIIQEATEQSAIMSNARRLPNMNRRQRRMPVLDALPTAYFVNANQDQSDTRHKKTTKVEWKDKFIDAEEIAVILPVPENVLDDSSFDIWGQSRPLVAEAIGTAFDRAVLYGEGAPNVWPDDLTTQIVGAGHLVAPTHGNDLYDAILGEDGVVAKIEEDGYMVDGHLARLTLRAKLRGLRDGDTGEPIFKRLTSEGVQGQSVYALDGEPTTFPRNGSFVPGDALELVSGDWTRLVYSIRQDITWKVLDQAVITDPTDDNKVIYNLPQQDMVALRVVFRAGWQLPNPPTRVNSDDNSRLPFAALGEQGS